MIQAANCNQHPVMNNAPPHVIAAYDIIAAHLAALPADDRFGCALVTVLEYAAGLMGEAALICERNGE